jgi:hypothetical protein
MSEISDLTEVVNKLIDAIPIMKLNHAKEMAQVWKEVAELEIRITELERINGF